MTMRCARHGYVQADVMHENSLARVHGTTNLSVLGAFVVGDLDIGSVESLVLGNASV